MSRYHSAFRLLRGHDEETATRWIWLRTSASRPANPRMGCVVYEQDTGRTLMYDGMRWIGYVYAGSMWGEQTRTGR